MKYSKIGTLRLKRYFEISVTLIKQDPSLRLFFTIAKAKFIKKFVGLGNQSTGSVAWMPEYLIDSPLSHISHNSIKIAVTAHIFYPEFVDKLHNALLDFPFQFDLFITTCDDEIYSELKKRFTNHEGRFYLRKAPNRGRHFAPLLVEYGKLLTDYELALHVHSKKSLHAKGLGKRWADNLWKHVLEDKSIVKKIVNEFLSNDNIAIYYPYYSNLLPHWAYTWARTEFVSKKFLEKLGMVSPSSPIAFPAGGMFWIRPSSYKEFLTHDFNYSDFPDELGQLDGTLQHALERIMGVYPSIKGLDHLVYVSEIDRFTLDTSFIWSTYTFKTGELLAEHLIPFQGISFDFFDTLYRREHQFQDIAKYNTGKHLAKATGLSAIEFVILRNQTELRMREILGKDVSLLEVTTELAKKINVDSEYLYDLECHFEYIEAMPRTEMVRMLNKLIEMNKRILIISDTYYDVDFIERLAEKIGLQKGIEYYISTDLNARKDSGSMWHLLLKNSIVDISSHVHVGDNFLSDGQIPGDLGIYTTLVMSGEAKWRRAGLPEYNITLNTLNEDPNAFVKSKLISEFGDSPF